MGSNINKKCVIISAVNFSEGGPLTVLQDCLASASNTLTSDWKIIALVHKKELISENRVQCIEYPKAKRSWIFRLYYEWFAFSELSKKIKPDLWLSLHDITPRVTAKRQAVYCHNPAPFYDVNMREASFEPKFWLFSKFYRYLYQLLIKRNYFVVVQQNWLRDAFNRMYGELPLLVAYPKPRLSKIDNIENKEKPENIFFYPALPRIFKNFELICEAAVLLASKNIANFEIRLTLSGDENRYSREIYTKYKGVPNLKFIGLQNREQMAFQYLSTQTVIFPSKLETWGLPISEAKLYKKSLLVADLPYAHETVGNYDRVSFFPPKDASKLADLMQEIIEGKWHPEFSKIDEPQQPFASNWPELWSLLINGL